VFREGEREVLSRLDLEKTTQPIRIIITQHPRRKIKLRQKTVTEGRHKKEEMKKTLQLGFR